MHQFNKVILAAIFILSGCSKSPDTSSDTPPVGVMVSEVTLSSRSESYQFIGQAKAAEQVILRARVKGILQARPFKEGSEVKENDLLYKIEPNQYQVAYDQATAKQAKAEASLKKTQLDKERIKALLEKQSVSQAQFDDADAAASEAEAEVKAAQAAVAEAQLNLDYTEIHAPISGTIDESRYDVGNLVGPESDTLAIINKMDPIYVTFNISETAYLAKKQATLKLDEAERSDIFIPYIQFADGTSYAHSGNLNFIDNKIDNTTGTILVRAQFSNPDHLLVPGQYLTVVVKNKTESNVLMIPQSAVMTDLKGHLAWVVDENNTVSQKRIKLGEQVGTKRIVLDGLAEGEQVVTQGLQKIKPGMTVQVQKEETKQ